MPDKKRMSIETASQTSPTEAIERGGEATPQRAASQKTSGGSSLNKGISSADPPQAPSGISSSLQPDGTVPGGGPGASVGSIGTGGGQTQNRNSGSLKRDGR
jgi:hypothetical protein